jgi:ssRNA-specific RNase YbeY (16S rRNA maturation enzyme)
VHDIALAFAADAKPLGRRNGVAEYGEVAIILTGDKGIARIHRDAMGTTVSTDVITLPYAAIPGSLPTAEIFINADRAVSCGTNRSSVELIGCETRRTWSPAHELALYIAHGFDHLAGADDASPAGFKAMRKREIGWVDKAAAGGRVGAIYKREESGNV